MHYETADKLRHDRTVELLNILMKNLSELDPGLYYLPTYEIAALVQDCIKKENYDLLPTEYDLLKDLTRRDIQSLIGSTSKLNSTIPTNR